LQGLRHPVSGAAQGCNSRAQPAFRPLKKSAGVQQARMRAEARPPSDDLALNRSPIGPPALADGR
jgi:hypothetical protein